MVLRRVSVGAVAAAIAGVLLLSGCGGGGSDGSADEATIAFQDACYGSETSSTCKNFMEQACGAGGEWSDAESESSGDNYCSDIWPRQIAYAEENSGFKSACGDFGGSWDDPRCKDFMKRACGPAGKESDSNCESWRSDLAYKKEDDQRAAAAAPLPPPPSEIPTATGDEQEGILLECGTSVSLDEATTGSTADAEITTCLVNIGVNPETGEEKGVNSVDVDIPAAKQKEVKKLYFHPPAFGTPHVVVRPSGDGWVYVGVLQESERSDSLPQQPEPCSSDGWCVDESG